MWATLKREKKKKNHSDQSDKKREREGKKDFNWIKEPAIDIR